MVLYKEKLNLKPPGGSGFAPHLDAPSLRAAFDCVADRAPRAFVTVMIAIDDMNSSNGCLRVARGPWTEDNHVDVIVPPSQKANGNIDDLTNSNPDAGGRAGAIPNDVANQLVYEDVVCKGGTIVAFNGWVPHRSAVNRSPFARRAVFLTYNPVDDGGDYRDLYYRRMAQLRDDYRRRLRKQRRANDDNDKGTSSSGNDGGGGENHDDERSELNALATIPRI